MISDAELAVTAALAGAAVVREGFGKPFSQLVKAKLNFATNVDIDAERAIVEVLQQARPADAILGEESGRHGRADRLWLIDPLCGTGNFAAQVPIVAVNVALSVGCDPTVGACVDPFRDEVFWTDGAQARLRVAGSDRRIEPSATSRLVELNLEPPFPNGHVFRAARLLAEDEFNADFRPRVVASTLALAWVAAGRRAAFLSDGDLRDNMHFASGVALCQAAGCVVTGLLGQPLHTGVGGLLAAADAATHAALLDLVRRQFPAGPGP